MKLKLIKISVIKLLLITPVTLFSQGDLSFAVYLGLNKYFQGTPIMRQYTISNGQKILGTQSNFGIYIQKKTENTYRSIGLNYASAYYRDVARDENLPITAPLNRLRMLGNVELTFGKQKTINKRLYLLYGLGTNIRIGYEEFLMRVLVFEYWKEANIDRIFRLDPGFHLNSMLHFNISQRFSIFGSLNFSVSPYLIDRKNLHRSREQYIYENGSYIQPVRFDLSLRLGLNFNLYR